MTATFDPSPWGTHLPGAFDRAVLALTRAMPANWFGQRLAILFRKLTMSRLGEGAIDTALWGMRLRLYPRRNGCEKNALFTPQMYDTMERRVLAQAVGRKRAGAFTFIDIGANVGLYSLYLASCGDVRTLAIEPQPGILERLNFHLAANPSAKVEVLPIALSDRAGAATLVINDSDSGGTHLAKDGGRHDAGERVSVPSKPLIEVLSDAGIGRVDALKIDVEGAEDIVLEPFLRAAPQSLLPLLLLIEDTRGMWGVDLFALLAARGYTVQERSRQNVALRLGA
ncbi:MAG: FkbM family methyltransferase [Alphaproteobacteria bacterium]|nr:MAG: FkbM family methyltransferase [Alphaproteobacteria bacterium]